MIVYVFDTNRIRCGCGNVFTFSFSFFVFIKCSTFSSHSPINTVNVIDVILQICELHIPAYAANRPIRYTICYDCMRFSVIEAKKIVFVFVDSTDSLIHKRMRNKCCGFAYHSSMLICSFQKINTHAVHTCTIHVCRHTHIQI